MKNSTEITKEELYSKVQELTEKLIVLDKNYTRDMNKIREELTSLQDLIANLTIEEWKSSQAVRKSELEYRKSSQDPNKSLELGDVVIITNSRNGLQGTVGVLCKLNTYWAWVQGKDPNIKPIQRARFNMEIVEHPYHHGYYQNEREQWGFTGKGKAVKDE